MLVTMSNPGLEFAMVGNPGPARSRRFHPKRIRRNSMRRSRRLSARQWAALRKGWRSTWANPGTALGARKARRVAGRRRRATRKQERSFWTRRARGYKVTVRARAGKRKANKRWARSRGIRRRTGRFGTIGIYASRGRGRRSKKLIATNSPRRRRARRNPRRKSRGWRRNPAVARTLSVRNWTQGLTGLPSNLPAIFKGKGVVGRTVAAGGGMIGGIVLGGAARGLVMNVISRVAPTVVDNRIVQGVLGAAITYSGGYLAGSMLIKNPATRNAFVTGAAVAAIVNALLPGRVNALLTRLPVIGPQLAMLPGMSGYVSAPSYQGIGTYVSAPGYQGVGRSPNDAVAGIGYDDALAGELGTYVQAPGYQGVGMYGQSHLDQ